MKIDNVKSKVFIYWQDVKADYYKVFCVIGSDAFECTRTYDTTYVQISLVKEAEFYVQAVKNDSVIKETPKYKFSNKEFDTAIKKTENKLLFFYPEYTGADGYRLYKNENGFVGCKNSKTTKLEIETPNETEFKIKPFKDKDGNREFLTQSNIVNIPEFEFVTLYKSFDGLFLSWNFKGEADGFEVYTTGSKYPVFITNEWHTHFYSTNDFKEDTKFIVKAFINTPKGKITISESEPAGLTERKYSKPEISLVIPAYNSYEYIARSIDSALANNFDDLEIVIVNDGSTDNTQEVIDWYSKNYPNISAYQKQNEGLALTRNYGIAKAKGNYIAFMDNDDFIRPDMYSSLYNAIKETSADIAISPLYRISNNGYSKHYTLPFDNNKSVPIDEWFKIAYTPGYYNCAVWNKLYKASIVKEHPLGNLKYEDVSWTPCISSWAETFVYVNKPFYEWDRKLRPETWGEVLAKMDEKIIFENRRLAMRFFVENGNQSRKDALKTLAVRRLNRYLKSDSEYSKIIDEINIL